MGEFENLFLLCLEQALWSNFHSLSFTCTRLYYLHLLQLVCSYFFLFYSAKVSYDKLFDTIKWSFVFSIKVQFSSSSKLGQIGPYGVQGQIWKTKFVRPSIMVENNTLKFCCTFDQQLLPKTWRLVLFFHLICCY